MRARVNSRRSPGSSRASHTSWTSIRPLTPSSAFLLTYDEHGGYFDHVAPPQIDAYGLGVRVPLWVVSPYGKRGPVKSKSTGGSQLDAEVRRGRIRPADPGLPEHALRHLDPDGGNFQANGAAAPPRDGRSDLSDLLDLFDF
jgi:phospholipase C